MPQKIIAAKLQLDGTEANTSVKSFKQQLKEANNELINMQAQFGSTSDEALEAAKRVAQLRDSVKDANEVAELFDPGAKFQVFGNVLKTVAGGFSAVTGTMALLGDQSEEVEKALLKVQAALAITEGVNTIVDSAKDFERLKALITQTTLAKKADEAATKSAAVVQRLFTGSVNTTSTGFKNLKLAIAATGIGLLVVAVGALIANFDKVKKVILNLIPGLGSVADFIGNIINRVTDFLGITSEAERQVAKTLEETQKKIKESERFLDLNADKYDQYTNRKFQADLNYQKKKAEFLEDDTLTESKRTELIRQAANQRNRALQQADKDRQDAIDKAEEEAAKKRQDQAKREADEAKKKEEQRRADFLKSYQEQLQMQDELDKEARKKAAIKNGDTGPAPVKLDGALKQLEINAMVSQTIADNNQKALRNLFDQQQALQDEIDISRETELESLERWYNDKMAIAVGNEELQLAIKQDYEDKKTKLEKAANEQRLAIAGNLLGQAAGLFAKHTAAYKVLAVAQATIQTYQSAQGAFAGMVSSIPGPVGVALGIAAAALAVATGIKNIVNIVKTKVPGESGVSTPSISTASISAPLAPQASTTSLDRDSIAGIGNAATGVNARAFVLESDVTDNQERISRLNRAARLA